MSKLTITGNPNPKIENLEIKEHIEQSIFKDNYFKAIKIINSIIKENTKQNDNDNDIYHDCTNNLVIFEGDRGTGKTSCMLSLSKLYDKKILMKI